MTVGEVERRLREGCPACVQSILARELYDAFQAVAAERDEAREILRSRESDLRHAKVKIASMRDALHGVLGVLMACLRAEVATRSQAAGYWQSPAVVAARELLQEVSGG